MQTIHFKVAAQNSIRRFALDDPTYTALRGQIASLFGLDVNGSWSLQYRDEENLLFFSTDEELKFACQQKKFLHIQVVLRGCEVRFSPKEKKEKKERGARKPRSIACLSKKQIRIRERISGLVTEDSERANSKKEKLEQKLAEVTAELGQLSLVFKAVDNSSNVPSKPSCEVAAPTVPLAESKDVSIVSQKDVDVSDISKHITPAFNKQLLKEVSARFFGMRRELQQDRKRVHSLSKVLKAMQTLSRHGSRPECGVQVSAEQVEHTKASLLAAKDEFSVKQEQVRSQSELLQTLEKEQNQSVDKMDKKDFKGRRTWKDKKEARKDKKEKREKRKEKKDRRRRWDSFSSTNETEKMDI